MRKNTTITQDGLQYNYPHCGDKVSNIDRVCNPVTSIPHEGSTPDNVIIDCYHFAMDVLKMHLAIDLVIVFINELSFWTHHICNHLLCYDS